MESKMKNNIQREIPAPKIKDHREIGQEQDYFSFSPFAPGLPFQHKKGVILKDLLVQRWKKLHHEYDYEEIESPMILKDDLWKKSGHYDLYKENMFFSQVDNHNYALKPMNCPGAILFYQNKKRYSHDLPLRVCEMGKVHRFENSGSLHGLLRVRAFSVDDGHIFCREDQLKDEIDLILKMIQILLGECGFNQISYELSLRGLKDKDRYLGEDKDWIESEEVLRGCLKDNKLNFIEREGEAKFYGPAIDVFIKDSSGKNWQCSSIQLDFNLARRFDLSYSDGQGKKRRPYLIHRALFGSLERFMGILLEHHQGRLPFWLSPIQGRIFIINEHDQLAIYAQEILKELKKHGFRFDIDLRKVNIKRKVRDYFNQLIPYRISLGIEELNSRKISVHGRGRLNKEYINLSIFLKMLYEKLNSQESLEKLF